MPMAALRLLLLALAVACCAVAEPPQQERSALRAFLAGTPHERALAWNASTPACAWVGVTCDAANATVVALRLPGVGLIGRVPQGTLGALRGLRVLSLRSNRLFGDVPGDLFSLPDLRSLFLQGNLFSGSVPPDVAKLTALQHLTLSHNNLTGAIPFALNGLANLRSLRLDGNRFSGSLPSLTLPLLEDFNVSYNQLNGSIPASLARFPPESFAGNLQLCGKPLSRPCEPFFPSPAGAPTPTDGRGSGGGSVPVSEKKKKKLSGAAVAAIAVGGGAAALLALVLLVVCTAASRRRAANGEVGKTAAARGLTPPSTASGELGELTSSTSKEIALAAAAATAERSRLVFVGKGAAYSFDLEELLRASAEVLGKGSVGTSYKAVLEEGATVVVKRLKEVAASRREFSAHLDSLGKVDHRNLLPVRGYYFSKDEKLLVCDYLPAGSLSATLHGSRGTGRRTMDWDARMRAALSAARGVAHLHAAHSLAHGNLKSSNLLLRPDPDAAALSDYCLHQLFAPLSARPNAGGYRAPELVDARRPTFKSDVYSLGVLFLELLTGKSPGNASVDGDGAVDLPRWVQSVVREEWTAEVFDVELVRLGGSAEEEMVALLQVAMACVATAPDARPDTADVVKMIEEIGSGHGRTTTEESEDRSRGTPPAGTTP
ncbi:probable inactive receptor kinase At2g26730 [Oryza glaberrima]|uniref:probable inactive receptor kinase At2g26730 n=1 Tax=Oryza glaberrima TaxID=4538 RepID=UPI00224C30EA|nr:probable inactive receptor kinase At2g26730 [Oryza glaberrima]